MPGPPSPSPLSTGRRRRNHSSGANTATALTPRRVSLSLAQDSEHWRSSKAKEDITGYYRHRANSVSLVSPPPPVSDWLFHASRSPPSSTLFVGRVPHSTRQAHIRRAFRRYGPILQVILFTKEASSAMSGYSEEAFNFGFISFASSASVDRVMGQADSRKISVPGEEPTGGSKMELIIERRRDQRPNAIEKLTERYSIVPDPDLRGYGGCPPPPSQPPTRSQRGFRLSSPPSAKARNDTQPRPSVLDRPRSHTFSLGGGGGGCGRQRMGYLPTNTPPRRQQLAPHPPHYLQFQQKHIRALGMPLESIKKTGPSCLPKRPLAKDLDPDSPWRRYLLHEFDWRKAATRYLYRESTMEDYLAEFIHALAAYRSAGEEPCSDLMNLLISLSDSCPSDPMHLMPPSISGLVYNQTKGRRPLQLSSTSSSSSSSSTPSSSLSPTPPMPQRQFRVHGILERRQDLFKVSKDQKTLTYKQTEQQRQEMEEGKEEGSCSRHRLVSILVEGVFVYFFAKFCHGASFPIAFAYYQRSEPVGSAVRLVAGCRDPNHVGSALVELFHQLKEVFVFSPDSCSLALIADMYKEENKQLTKSILSGDQFPPLSPTGTIPECACVTPRSSASEEADIHNIISATLSPVHKAKKSATVPVPLPTKKAAVRDPFQIHSLPLTVQSVVRSVLQTEEEEELNSGEISSSVQRYLPVPEFPHHNLPTPNSRGSSSFSFEDDVFESAFEPHETTTNNASLQSSSFGSPQMLLTNPSALDSVLDRMLLDGSDLGGMLQVPCREDLKVRFEAESRQTIARLLVEANANAGCSCQEEEEKEGKG